MTRTKILRILDDERQKTGNAVIFKNVDFFKMRLDTIRRICETGEFNFSEDKRNFVISEYRISDLVNDVENGISDFQQEVARKISLGKFDYQNNFRYVESSKSKDEFEEYYKQNKSRIESILNTGKKIG